MKNKKIEGYDYQQGSQLVFWNVREYVLFRDEHKCQHCKGKIDLKIKRSKSYKDATFMGIMRWSFYNQLEEIYLPLGMEVKDTYGYLTKNKRIENNLPKENKKSQQENTQS